MSKDHYAQCSASREHTNLPMDSKELLANLRFGCTECVPGDRAAAAACPVCQKVAKEVADRESCPATAWALALELRTRGRVAAAPGLDDEEDDEDDEDEEDDDDDDKHNVLDYDPDLSDDDYAAHTARVGATEEATEEAAEEAVGMKRKAAHGHDCEYDGNKKYRMLEDLIDMKRRHADELSSALRKMPDPLYLTKSEEKEATALIADLFPGCEEDAMVNRYSGGGFCVADLVSDLVSE